MELNEVLTHIAAQIHADPDELIAYAQEDDLGGFHVDPDQSKFPMGSLWGVEGQILYALTRHLKPELIVEIGGWAGASASHFALAVIANGYGKIISVDNHVGGMDHGHLLTDEFRKYVTLINANGQDWLRQQPNGSIGLLFEDADHSTPLVAELSSLGLQKLAPGGILANHDAAHDFYHDGNSVMALRNDVNFRPATGSDVGRAVRDGLAQANAHFTPYLAAPSDCGLAITVNPGEWVAPHIKKLATKIQTRMDNLEPQSEPEAIKQALSPEDFARALQMVGNANIESVSQPPSESLPQDWQNLLTVISDEPEKAAEPKKTGIKSQHIDMREMAELPPGLRASQNKKEAEPKPKTARSHKAKPKT